MALHIRSLLAFLVCSVLSVSFCHADIIEGSGIFSNSELSDANNEVMSTITITDSGIIRNISVTINNIEHSNTGDLIAELRFLGPGGPSGPGGLPAYLFFRPNVDDVDLVGSRGNLNGDYTFTDNETDADFWSESAIPDDEDVPDNVPYAASDQFGVPHDLGGPNFFEGFNVEGEWQLVITDANTGANENNDGTVDGWTIEFHVDAIPEPGFTAIFATLSMIAAGYRRRKSA